MEGLKSNHGMPPMFGRRIQGVSDDAVRAKTGKKWDEWFKLLDNAGTRMMDHREIARCVDWHFELTPGGPGPCA